MKFRMILNKECPYYALDSIVYILQCSPNRDNYILLLGQESRQGAGQSLEGKG